MLRYFYLLSLLICFNLSFCYEYSPDKDSSSRSSIGRFKADYLNRKNSLQHRKQRKRHDYDMYDKDQVAEIDVASFINNAEDDPINENYQLHDWKRRYEKGSNNYGKIINEISNSDDYLEIDEDNLQEASQYMKTNPVSEDKIISDKLIHKFDKILNDNSEDIEINEYSKPHKEKKCALTNFKFPFFSHNKSAIDKGKGNKKRKLHGFNDARKGNIVYKGSTEKISKEDNSRDRSNVYKHDKIDKRSYIEQLCPACRKKFIVRQNFKPPLKRSNILNNKYDVIQNTNSENNGKNSKKYNVDSIIRTSGDKDILENFWNDRRRKREDDDRNIERQKELDYIEKRVEGVTVNNPSYNTIKS